MDLQEFYTRVFSSSRLQTHSGLDMSDYSTEAGLNLFFVPRILNEGTARRQRSFNYPVLLNSRNSSFFIEPTMRQNEKKLIEKLKTKIHGVNRNPMTPTTLTEKNW